MRLLLRMGEFTMTRLMSCCAVVVIAASGSVPASASNDANAKCQSLDPAIAIPACTTIIGSSNVAPNARAMAYARRGMRTRDTDRQAAIRDFTAAIASYKQLDPREPDAQLRISSNTSQFYALRGREHYALHDYERAKADYNRAIALDEKASNPRLLRGLLYATLNETEAAISDLSAAIKLDPSNAEAYSYRGRIQAELGKLDQGFADLSKAVKLAPEKNEYRNFRDEVQHEVLLKAFTTGSASRDSDLRQGFSQVAEYKW